MTLHAPVPREIRMLAVLRLARGRPVRRDVLVAAIYPDPERRPATALSQPDALAVKLRRAGHPVRSARGRGYWLAPEAR